MIGTLVYTFNNFHGLDVASVLQSQSECALLWIIDTAPFWLGLFAGLAGKREDALQNVIQEREATIDSRTEDLKVALHRAEAATRAKGRFLANMSHELRTPMTAILGYAEILQDSDVPARQHDEAVRIICSNGEHLLQVINDILDVSKIESDRMTIERLRCDPREIVAGVVALMDIQARRKGLEFRAVFSGPIPRTILSDPTRIRQILLNLVGNAIKFTAQGQVQLKVRLVGRDEAPRLEFKVCDTGIGMSGEQIERLFQSFSQADDSISRKYGGAGLGLAICRRLVELMSGECGVESAPDSGSVFMVRLPVGELTGVELTAASIEDTSTVPPSTLPAGRSAAPGLDDCHILLAEDNAVNARVISLILEKQGARIDVVGNGRIALETALARLADKEPYDIILMDIQMPEMDGYEATRRLRETGYDLPILALTANVLPADHRRCVAAGCDDCATKPINRTELVEQIQRLTGSTSRPVRVMR